MQLLVVTGQEFSSQPLAPRLERHGYDVVTVTTGAAALDACGSAELVLLDLELPDIDGLEVCRRIRNTMDTPIIAFTDSGADLDRVLGLQAGSDDCLEKPYEFRELMARIDAVMRRAWRPRSTPRTVTGSLTVGDMCIDGASREVRLRGTPIQLTRKEFDLLYYLARHSDTVVTRRRLMTEIWDDSSAHALSPRASRTIDTHVSSLRSKLGSSGWIVTVRGVGFRLGQGRSQGRPALR
ncbi:response regulator transcription factor [Streptomyces sp. NPDC057376]|uniref:response regulator transcription factor n=1 Tax=unclassified Streptomyces TaxID=2593676 RepID=UPI00093A21F9|nr:response regulator transcription factor [Streptomyces sp. CB02414]OKI81334.1 transcriptional regulator [Streptomyces sp. CB02414]